MSLSFRELWTAVHGFALGGLFLLSYTGVMVALFTLRPEWVTEEGAKKRLVLLKWGTIVMAVIAFLTVASGTFISYPWYRAAAPEGADLAMYARSFLLANENLAGWHEFGMEWKEHIAWLSPFLAFAVAFLVSRYDQLLVNDARFRNIVMLLFSLAFGFAAIAGVLGAFITKAAPVI